MFVWSLLTEYKEKYIYLQEHLPELLIFMYSFITGEYCGAGYADDVVDVDDLGGDVAERCEADQDFLPCCWWTTNIWGYYVCNIVSSV